MYFIYFKYFMRRNAQEAGVTEMPPTKMRKKDCDDNEVDEEGDVNVPCEQYKQEEIKAPRRSEADDRDLMDIDNDI